MKLTEKQIEQIVEAVKNELLKQMLLMTHENNYPSEAVPKATILSLLPLCRTALSTITLSQPKQIDLNEVEKLLMYADSCNEGLKIKGYDSETFFKSWREDIGYTLNDLTPNTTEK